MDFAPRPQSSNSQAPLAQGSEGRQKKLGTLGASSYVSGLKIP